MARNITPATSSELWSEDTQPWDESYYPWVDSDTYGVNMSRNAKPTD